MMNIEPDKSFGYPVLRPLFVDQNPADLDYVNIPFEPTLGMAFDRSDTDSFIFTWEYECGIEDINKHLKNGAIRATLHLYNRITWLNESFDLNGLGPEGEISIDKALFSGPLESRLIFRAAEDIEIASQRINEDYGYKSFSLAKNSIVAFSESFPYKAEANLLKQVKSLFELEERADLQLGEFFYDSTGDSIIIYASEEQILKLREFEVSEKLQNYVSCAVYAPIVTDLVKLVFAKQDDDTSTEAQLSWFQTIQHQMEALPPRKLQKHRPEVTAHNLLKLPLGKISAD
jgi:hypothetical protein